MGWDSLSTMDGEGPWARSLWVLREGERERKKACTDERVQQEYQEQNRGLVPPHRPPFPAYAPATHPCP